MYIAAYIEMVVWNVAIYIVVLIPCMWALLASTCSYTSTYMHPYMFDFCIETGVPKNTYAVHTEYTFRVLHMQQYCTAFADVLHSLHVLSILSSLMKGEPEMSLHTYMYKLGAFKGGEPELIILWQ